MSVLPQQCHRWSDPSDLLLGLTSEKKCREDLKGKSLQEVNITATKTDRHTHLDLS